MRQRLPRQRNPRYLAYIARLPCVLCLTKPVECAHVRYTESCRHCMTLGNFKSCSVCQNTRLRFGKRHVGAGEKPCDWWVAPLCPNHHRNGPYAQHSRGERAWWLSQGIDPLRLCMDLRQVYPDVGAGEATIRELHL